MSACCTGLGPSRRRLTTRANSTAPAGPGRKSAVGNSRISRSTAAAAPTRRSKRWPRMSTSSCYGANRWRPRPGSWGACEPKPRSAAATRPSASRPARSWRRPKARPGIGPGRSSTGCSPIAAALRRRSARMSAPNGSCRPRRRPTCTTPACGHRSPPRPAPRATRRLWSARPKPSRRRSLNTTSSAPPAS